jgi:[ribosomal protein S5]-alanine N-acetyltransferase
MLWVKWISPRKPLPPNRTRISKGYGSEATRLLVRHGFETLNLHRIWLHVYEYNERGIRAYERVGFQREGVLRQDRFYEGRYWNTLVMGILREEWIEPRS